MVLSGVDSAAATKRAATMRPPSGGTSLNGPNQALVEDPGIVEGWRGDEDEDVDIDTDEKESGVEGLAEAREAAEIVQCAAPGFRGVQARTRAEDLSLSQACKKAAKSSHAPSVDGALENQTSLGVRTGKVQLERVGSGRAFRGGLSSGSSARRMDARRFRRNLSIGLESSSPKFNAVPESRGNVRSDGKDRLELAKEKGTGRVKPFSSGLSPNLPLQSACWY
jgi:hypothetical protein